MPENDANDLAELGEDILTFDVSDHNDRTLHSLVALQLATIASAKEQ